MNIPVAQETTPASDDVVELPSGCEVALPARYEDWSVAGALFPADRAGLRELLPEPLVPASVAPGLGAVGIAGIDYRETAVGPYDEVAVTVPAGTRRGPPGRAGYVHALPVTTEDARDLGRQVWGYPKELADITVERADGRVRVAWHDDGDHVLTLTVPDADGRRRENAFVTYSGDAPTRARIDAHGEFAVRPLAGVTLELGSAGVGPTLTELLPSEPLDDGDGVGFALAALRGRNVRSRLPRGEPV